MNPSPQESDALTRTSNSAEIRWDGHMCDGVGSTSGPKPTAFLCANADELVLSGNRGTFRLARASIREIGRGKFYPWFFGGLTIRHNVAHLPNELQFQAIGARSREILHRLRELGYPVS